MVYSFSETHSSKVSAVDRIRTRTWFDYIAKGKTPYWIWKNIENFEYVQRQRDSRNRIFQEHLKGHKSKLEKYKSGSRNPGPKFVKLMAEYFPGSDHLFSSCIWTIIGSENVTIHQIFEDLNKLGPTVQTQILMNCYWDKDKTQIYCNDIDAIISRLDTGNFNTLQAIILCLAWVSKTGNHNTWNKFCHLYRKLLSEFIFSADIPNKFELFDAIDEYAQIREITSETSYTNIRKIWSEEDHQHRSYLANHYAECLKKTCISTYTNDEISEYDYFLKIANSFIDIFWPDKKIKYDSLEYWRPLSSFFSSYLLEENFIESYVKDPEIRKQALRSIQKHSVGLKKKKQSLLESRLFGQGSLPAPNIYRQHTGLFRGGSAFRQ